MEHILAILDENAMYARKLSRYMEQKKRLPFTIMGFSQVGKLEKFLGESKAEILLCQDTMWKEDYEKYAKKCLYLTEDKDFAEEPDYIYKYQSADEVARKILSHLADSDEVGVSMQRNKTYQGDCQVIGVYTPVGRTLQSSFCFVYAGLKGKNKKVLYLNFEIFAGFEAWFHKEYQSNLLDLMYFLDGKEERFLCKLQGMMEQCGNFYYVPPMTSYADFSSITPAQWEKLIEMLATKGGFDVILLDLNHGMQGLFEVLDMCQRVYMMCRSDGVSVAKIDDFTRMYFDHAGETGRRKLIPCRLPVFKNLPQEVDMLCYSQLADFMKRHLGSELM